MSDAKILRVFAGAIAVVCAVVAPAIAQTQKPLPDGVAVGRWFLSPYLFQGIEHDDNVFRACDDAQSCEEARSDWIRRTTAGFGAKLPIRNSALDLEYTADRYDYQENDFGRNWTHDGLARLTLNFSGGDRLILGQRYSTGLTDVRSIDEGGELTFLGVPYNLSRTDLELSRSVPRRQGYSIAISRIDLNWEPEADQTVPFFDYRGFDTKYEFRQPIPGDRWLVVYHDRRLFNQYRARGTEGWSLGVPFRKEESGSLQVGMRGSLSRGQSFRFSLGWGSFEYSGLEASPGKFRGLVGRGELDLWFGPRTSVTFEARRRALPSSFPTYYIVNEFRVRGERQWLQYSRAGLEMVYARNDYGDPIPGVNCSDDLRRDTRWETEAFVEWLFHRYVGLRLAASRASRRSNCAGSDYDANVAFAGLTLGWF